MVNVQAGPNDVPNPCPRCQQMTLHRPGPDGRLYCLPCMTRPALAPQVQQPPPQPQVVYVQQQKSGGGIVTGTIKTAGFIVSLLFLLCLGTCVYVCGSVANETSSSSSSSGR